MYWYLGVLKKYAVFNGRAHRQEYWMFVLFYIIIMFALVTVETVLGIPGFISLLYSLVLFLPSFAVAVRRLHDTGRSGWWLLIGIIPIIGGLVILFFMVQDSNPGDNPYGPNPKTAPPDQPDPTVVQAH